MLKMLFFEVQNVEMYNLIVMCGHAVQHSFKSVSHLVPACTEEEGEGQKNISMFRCYLAQIMQCTIAFGKLPSMTLVVPVYVYLHNNKMTRGMCAHTARIDGEMHEGGTCNVQIQATALTSGK